MTTFTFTMSEEQARRVHALVASQCASTKNWMASSVETEDYERAHRHVEELRALEALFAATNIDAKYTIAQGRGKPLETEITVQERSR